MNTSELLQIQYERFCEEVDAIKEQLDFIEESIILTSVREKKIASVESSILNFESIEEVHRELDVTIKKISMNIDDLEKVLMKKNYEMIPEKFLGIDYRSEEGELIQAIIEVIKNGEVEPIRIADEISAELEVLCITEGENIYGDIYLELYHNKDKLMEYIDICLKMHNNNYVNNVKENIEVLEHNMKLLKLIDTRKSTNIYRQAFIQLIAIFDTIVFECFRIIFSSDFFEWLEYFKDGSIKYHEISKYKTFEVFQEKIIEEKLRSCYIKDLLNIAYIYNKRLFIIDGKDTYHYFVEMINRRNCHIHNNGIVDKAYLGTVNSQKESFNIYDLKVGDYLEIERNYFSQSLEMCKSFILNFIKE